MLHAVLAAFVLCGDDASLSNRPGTLRLIDHIRSGDPQLKTRKWSPGKRIMMVNHARSVMTKCNREAATLAEAAIGGESLCKSRKAVPLSGAQESVRGPW